MARWDRWLTRAQVVTGIVVALAGAGATWWALAREAPLVSAAAATATMRAELTEYGRHIGEAPEASAVLLDDARGRLVAQRYADGCVALSRTWADGTRSRILADLARDPDAPPRAGWAWATPVYAAGAGCPPHAGPFRQWTTGTGDRCWVRVWRQWPDGCTHWQLADVCHGGALDAAVHWERCNH